MMHNAPPRVDVYDNGERYWLHAPPSLSARCRYWVARIDAGWRPGKRIRMLGYYGAATYYGVYIFEWLYVLSPLLDEVERVANQAR